MEIHYTAELAPEESIFRLYERLQWNDFLQLDPQQLGIAMKQSWYSLYVYQDKELIGTGRVVSDGMINAYLCGVGVHPDYRHRGIGTEIIRRLVKKCQDSNLYIQFFCEEELLPFYEAFGFVPFAVGMKAPKA